MFKKKKTSTLSCQYRFPEHQLMLTISQSLFTLSISPLLSQYKQTNKNSIKLTYNDANKMKMRIPDQKLYG